MDERYRLKQYGIPVAWARGGGAIAEIAHYVLIYTLDGPVEIERHSGKRWRRLSPDAFRAALQAAGGKQDG